MRAALMKEWAPVMIAGFLICFGLTACAEKKVYTLPPVGEAGVPNLALDPRPKLDLTDKEKLDLYHFSPIITGKILKNQARWAGYANIADASVQGYQDYLWKLFAGKEGRPQKSEEPKKSWLKWKP